MEPWKLYQQMHDQFVREHSDAGERFLVRHSDDIIGKAVDFFKVKEHYAYYPGKQYAVSLIYAYLVERVYGTPLREALDDPDLILNPAYPHTPYSQDPDTYEEIIRQVLVEDSLMGSGWSSYTMDYWYGECTSEGVEAAMERCGGMSKPRIDLSINVTYYCNLRCSFCYLTSEQLSDKYAANLDDLKRLLDSISSHYEIGHIDLYGGEVALVPTEYFNELVTLVKRYRPFDVRLITNLTTINDIVMHPEVDLYVSYDFSARELHERVAKNLKRIDRPFHILTLATDVVVQEGTDVVLDFYRSLPNLLSVEIKPYSSNQANTEFGSNSGFYELVKGIASRDDLPFSFENISLLRSVIGGSRNAYSDGHLFITPQVEMAALGFDLDDREYFLKFNTIAEYKRWCEIEKRSVASSPACQTCPWQGRCLTEHYRNVEPGDGFCSGHRKLIEWYKDHSKQLR